MWLLGRIVFGDIYLEVILRGRAKKEVLKNSLVRGGNDILKPIFDPFYGYRFPKIEEIVGGPEETFNALEELASEGVLIKKHFRNHLQCPYCGSLNLNALPTCLNCGSFNVKKTSLVEHLRCGYIGSEELFRKDGKLVCPSCGMELKRLGEDYRNVGTWFECKDCGLKFDTLNISLACLNCGKVFPVRDSNIKEFYIYVLSEEMEKRRIKEEELVKPVVLLFEEEGYIVSPTGVVTGVSGASHRFDVVAEKDGERVLVDIIRSNQAVGEFSVLHVFVKSLDVGNSKSILIVIPDLTETASKLANQYNLKIIKAKNIKEAVTNLREILRS